MREAHSAVGVSHRPIDVVAGFSDRVDINTLQSQELSGGILGAFIGARFGKRTG